MCISNGISFNAVQSGGKLSPLRFASGSTDIAHLQTVDSVDATILVDNSIDILMASTDHVTRPPLTWDWSTKPQLIAEHGYSLLFSVQRKGTIKTILYDAGLSPDTVTHNISVLGIIPSDIDAVVLS